MTHRDRESEVVERAARASYEVAPWLRADDTEVLPWEEFRTLDAEETAMRLDMALAAIRETLMDMHDNFRPQPFSSWDDAVRHYAMRLSISLSPQEEKQ